MILDVPFEKKERNVLKNDILMTFYRRNPSPSFSSFLKEN